MQVFKRWRAINQNRPSPGNLRRLLQEVERYDRIFKGSHGYGFLDWDIEANFMFWDGGFWNYLGYSDKEMKRIANPDHFMQFVHPEDREHLSNTIERHIKMHGPGEAFFRILQRHGGYVWAEVRVEAIRDVKGHVLYTSGIIFDISKMKEIEDQLRLSEARHSRIIKASNDGIWEWTSEHGGFHFSRRCWEQLGFTEDDDLINEGLDRLDAWRDLIHPDDLVNFDKVLNDHFMKKSPFDVEYRIKGKNGEWLWIRARGQMHYSDDGRPWRMSGSNMDITELKKAEERVLKSKEVAEQANRSKSEFLSSMSHELRTPLNAILGFAQLFDLDTNLTRDQRDNINEIQKAGSHLLQLVGEVLDLAKIESGRMDMQYEGFDPIELIRDCVGLVQTQVDARGIEIVLLEPSSNSVGVYADRRRVKQVLLNLLSNAVKYNVENGKIYIKTETVGDTCYKISVTDTGRGISDELQKSLFQPFNRLGAESSDIEGSGVGLVISKRLVEQMGGAMEFDSTVGEGSTFSFKLPVELDVDFQLPLKSEASTADKLKALNDELSLTFTGSRRLLYVEDSQPNQRLMQQILSRYPQLELDIVGEGFSGLFEARNNPPDLIILDINLPGMSGYETLDIMRRDAITKNIPVIALSANAMDHDIESGINAGFSHYLTKPIHLPELIKVFNGVFSKVEV